MVMNFWCTSDHLILREENRPLVMKDRNGNLLVSDKAIQNEAIQVYSERFKTQ